MLVYPMPKSHQVQMLQWDSNISNLAQEIKWRFHAQVYSVTDSLKRNLLGIWNDVSRKLCTLNLKTLFLEKGLLSFSWSFCEMYLYVSFIFSQVVILEVFCHLCGIFPFFKLGPVVSFSSEFFVACCNWLVGLSAVKICAVHKNCYACHFTVKV